MSVVIEKLFIYPVKSLGSISLSSATLTTAGLKGDREWMLIDSNGKFASQRKYPLMATINPSLINNQLQLSNAEGDVITLKKPQEKHLVDVSLWKSRFQALKTHPEYSEWISDTVKSKELLRLVYFDKSIQRTVNEARFGKGYTFFSDGAPYLVANLESLKHLNKKLKDQKLPTASINQFRANIVISGLAAFKEHLTQTMQNASNSIMIGLKDHCQRCSVITVDPMTGIPSQKATPFKQLASINPMPDNPKAPAFGVNSILLSAENSIIKINDTMHMSNLT